MTTATAVRQPPLAVTGASGPFAALRSRPYRIYLSGQSVANMGTWMQGIAQDWLVLELTRSSVAVGVTMALQYTPTLLFGMYGGLLGDHFSRRRILITTQTTMGVLTAMLAVITVSGWVTPTCVYVFALLAGLVIVVDQPTRQVFVGEVVPPDCLRAGIALNAAVMQSTRLVGPAVASLLIATVGSGWVFAANAACYAGPTIGLLLLRPADLIPVERQPREPRALRTAVAYVAARPHVAWTVVLVGMVGTFGLNFPIVLSAMARSTFHGTASTYGLFNIALAIGSASGALLVGGRTHSRVRLIVATCAGFGLLQAVAACAPDVPMFLVLIAMMGMVNLAFQAMANAAVQLWVDPALRGRVMGLYMLVFTGGTPIAAPIVGAFTNTFGARAGMALCGVVPVFAATVAAVVFTRYSRTVRS